MDQQLSAIIRALTRPNLFPLRNNERDETARMADLCFQVNHQQSRVLSCPGSSKQAPKALLIHGWGGNPFMLKPQRDLLQQLGYEIYMPFLLGHDPACPEPCSIPGQVQLLLELQQQVGQFDLVIAHSAGGIITALAVTQGFVLNNVILLASPHSYPALLAHKLNEFPSVPGLKAALFERVSLTDPLLPALMSESLFSALDARLLIIHGTADRKIPCQDALSIRAERPEAELILVEDAGHLGVLHHQTTLQAITGFVRGRLSWPEGAQHDARTY